MERTMTDHAKVEHVAAAVRHLAKVCGEMGMHAGYSPAKRLEKEVGNLLEGKPLDPLPAPAPTTTLR
jgi:hypothetical protein